MKRVDSRRSLALLRRSRLGGSGHDSDRWYHPQLETLENRCLLSIAPSTVLDRSIFYNNSRYDGNVAAISAADNTAIAGDKDALLSGATATFTNVTSFSKGINGIMVDITGSHPSITASDFTFRVGNNNSPTSWTSAPNPSSISVRAGAGLNGSDRVEITWTDGAITKKWLQVIVEANERTGLAQSDVFFFGNAVGDSGLGDTAANATVNATDENGARLNPANLAANIPNTNIYDYDRNAQVNANDQNIARLNATNPATVVKYISVPTISPPVLSADLANDTGPGGNPNTDGITADPTIAGSLTAANSLVSFVAGLNGGPVSTDVLPLVQGGGAFTLSEAFLTSLNGGSLPDGAYTLKLEATDSQGLGAAVQVAFNLTRTLTPPNLPDLIAADDKGTSNTDNITNDNTLRIDVTTISGTFIRLYVDNVEVATGTASPTVQFTLPVLSDGLHDIKAVAEDGPDSAASPILTIDVRTVAPTISVATMVPFTDDLTPHVTVTSNGTSPVSLDVDINNDGDFTDAGENGRTTATLYNGSSYFQLTPALPATNAGAAYVVQLRARVSDVAGNEGVSPLSSLVIDTLGNNILSDYVHAPDASWAYDVATGSTAPTTFSGTGYVATVYDLHSQTWLTPADVNRQLWQHWMTVIVPNGDLAHLSTTAILFIDGGSNGSSRPTSADSNLVLMATTLNTVVINLKMVPNEPLTFTGDPGHPRSEDGIISYTFDQYTSHLDANYQPLAGYEDWPALLPMVKSAVKAMDTVQVVDAGLTGGTQIDDFVVTGYSKRGWTTWLTTAVDSRVRGIIPGVIDVLNMDEQMMHHYGFYNGVLTNTLQGFSTAIADYVAFGIPQDVQTLEGQSLGRVIDPYRYLNNGHFNIPKLMINSSGDEFFVPDSSQFYFSDLPGTQNYLRYIPNTGHGLNATEVTTSTISFTNAVIKNLPLPQYSWTILPDGSISVQTSASPQPVVKLWQGTNPNVRDFRNSQSAFHVTYTSSVLSDLGGGTYLASVATPATGATAYFVELTFNSPISGKPYIFTTEVKVASNIALATWPYYVQPSALNPLTALVAEHDSAFDAVASSLAALAAGGLDSTEAEPAPVLATPTAAIAVTYDEEEASYIATSDWPWTDEASDDSVLEDEEAVDVALSSLGADDFV